MRCLLVDDEPGIREGLAALLRLRGHEVHTAADCAGGQAALRERAVDVVVTDWRLPDGDASAIVAVSPVPVIAVSGHPDEVVRGGNLRLVLTKPLAPARLLELLAQFAPREAEPAVVVLPADVAAVIEQVRAATSGPVEIDDDGAFVTVSGRVGGDDAARLGGLGGDLQFLGDGAAPRFSLRLCRDGRPDPSLPVVPVAAEWPLADEFAVDFHDSVIDEPAMRRSLDRASQARRQGRVVHFLNAPASLAEHARLHGRAHDMPKKQQIGPRLPADLADLWRQP